MALFKKKPIKVYYIQYNGMLYIKGFHENQEINLLLNTGSENSIIDSSFVSQLDTLNVEEFGNDKKLCGIDTAVNPQSVYIIPFTANNYDLCESFVGLNIHSFKEMEKLYGVKIHGMLGCTFFNKYKCSINYKKLTLDIEL